MRRVLWITAAMLIGGCTAGDDDKADDTADADTDADTDSDTDADTDSDTDADTDADTFDVTLTGTGYAPHNGQTIRGVVVDNGDDSIAGSDSQVMDATGDLLLEFPGVMTAKGDYKVVWYADVTANDACDGPSVDGQDHAWSEPIESSSKDATVERDHDLSFDFDACTYWP